MAKFFNTNFTYSYDPLYRLTNVQYINPDNGRFYDHISYTYDNVGNRLSRTDKLGTESYEYDSMYRLTRANYADGNTTAFEYDPVGNRTKMIDSEEGETAYQYNSANQLIGKLHTSLLSNITQTAYTYDPAGNLKKKIENTEETIYTFDRKNMLLKIDYPQVAVPKPANEFKYNVFKRRTYKKDSEGERYYLYDGDHLIYEYNSNAEPVKRYVHGPGIDEPLAVEVITPAGTDRPRTVQRYYHLADGLGSVSYLINDAAKVIQEHRYRAFGERANTDAGLSRFTYTGREFDIDSGLYYYRSRYYDSSVGRFISKDMARDGLNYYTYVQNNPIRYADPRGEEGIDTSGETVWDAEKGTWVLADEKKGDPKNGEQKEEKISDEAAEKRKELENKGWDPAYLDTLSSDELILASSARDIMMDTELDEQTRSEKILEMLESGGLDFKLAQEVFKNCIEEHKQDFHEDMRSLGLDGPKEGENYITAGVGFAQGYIEDIKSVNTVINLINNALYYEAEYSGTSDDLQLFKTYDNKTQWAYDVAEGFANIVDEAGASRIKYMLGAKYDVEKDELSGPQATHKDYAKYLEGNKNFIDCSGFVDMVYTIVGLPIGPGKSVHQFAGATRFSTEPAQGALAYLKPGEGSDISHIVIYSGSGSNGLYEVIDASSGRGIQKRELIQSQQDRITVPDRGIVWDKIKKYDITKDYFGFYE